MPYIRVNCLAGALTPAKKAQLAAALVEIVMGQEIEPMTEIGGRQHRLCSAKSMHTTGFQAVSR